MVGCAKLEKCLWPSRPYRGKDEGLAPGLKDGQVGQHTVPAGFIPDRPGLSQCKDFCSEMQATQNPFPKIFQFVLKKKA